MIAGRAVVFRCTDVSIALGIPFRSLSVFLLLFRQPNDKLPLPRGNVGNAQTGLLEGLEVFERSTFGRVGFEVIQGDEVVELAAEFDVNNAPFGIIP